MQIPEQTFNGAAKRQKFSCTIVKEISLTSLRKDVKLDVTLEV